MDICYSEIIHIDTEKYLYLNTVVITIKKVTILIY